MYLSNPAPNGVVTLVMVNDSMLNEELRRKELEITSEYSALVIKNRRRNTHRNSHDDDKRDKSKMRSKSKIKTHSISHLHVTYLLSTKRVIMMLLEWRNNEVCKISRVRDVCVETSLGCKLILKKVRHVPDMRFHLISVGVFDDDGY
jgi:hypothetical protein